MKVSPSHLLVLALEDFVRRYQNRQLLEKVDLAYEDGPDDEEKERLELMRLHHRRIVEGEW